MSTYIFDLLDHLLLKISKGNVHATKMKLRSWISSPNYSLINPMDKEIRPPAAAICVRTNRHSREWVQRNNIGRRLVCNIDSVLNMQVFSYSQQVI